MKAKEAVLELESLSDKAAAAQAMRFFKTGDGEYGEGDVFRGVKVPVLRALSRKYRDMDLEQTAVLLRSKYHEDRMLALFIMVRVFEKGDQKARKAVFDLYLAGSRHVNNWDLVDSSAAQIVGGYLFDRDRKAIHRLARSRDLWERRIAVVSTYYFIKRGQFEDTLRIAAMLLDDVEDLIHKASGWMLREVGKRDRKALERFLDENADRMPRTMLRYAIEKLPDGQRRKYMSVSPKAGKP